MTGRRCDNTTMDFKNLFDDDRAVSPVIGVILMVAITVILAAVIGTFVLGLGDQLQTTAPSASIGFDYTNPSDGQDTLVITHETGAELTGSNVNVVVSGAGPTGTDGSYPWSGTDGLGGDTDVSAGSSVTLDTAAISGDGATLDLSGATVRVTWTSETGESSATLATWSGPEA